MSASPVPPAPSPGAPSWGGCVNVTASSPQTAWAESSGARQRPWPPCTCPALICSRVSTAMLDRPASFSFLCRELSGLPAVGVCSGALDPPSCVVAHHPWDRHRWARPGLPMGTGWLLGRHLAQHPLLQGGTCHSSSRQRMTQDLGTGHRTSCPLHIKSQQPHEEPLGSGWLCCTWRARPSM